jgi:hypothetical protein
MSVKGNSSSYTHSNLSWMKENAVHFNKSGIFRNNNHTATLCWSKIEQFPEHAVYAFRTVPGLLPIERPIESVLSVAIRDSSYYGRVNMAGAFNEKADKSLVGEIFDVPKVDVYSWGPFFVVYHKPGNKHMLAPKGLINECAVYMLGRKRDALNWQGLISHARHHCRTYNVPPAMLPDTVFAACCLAFEQQVSFETAVMHGIIEPMMKINEVHTNAMDLRFRWVWTKWAFIVAAVLFVGLFTTFGAMTRITAPVIGDSLLVATGVSLVVGLLIVFLIWRFRKVAFDPFERYRVNRSSNQPRKLVLACPTTPLPSTPPPKTLTELLTTPLDVTAKMKVGEVTANNDVPPLHPAGIVSTASIPVVPQNSAHSSLSALVERSLKAQPFHDEQIFDSDLFDQMQAYIMDKTNFSDIFPGLLEEKVVPLTFAQWNQRFPLSQAKRQKLVYKCYLRGFYPVDPIRQKPFTKTESLAKSDVQTMEESIPKLAPRHIQGATDVFNVVTAPFIQAFAKRLANMWSVIKPRG